MESIKLFYATNNKSKLHNMIYRLRNYPIQVLCPDDLAIHIDVAENGCTVVENAIIKSQAYYKVVNMPTIAADSSVWIDGIPEKDQPGLLVRRVNGKVLSDDEMIDYYASLAERAKEECYLHYVTGIVLVTEKETFTMELKDAPLKLVPIANSNRKHRGNPLDVITQIDDGRYFNELSDEERTDLDKAGEQGFTDFIVKNLLTEHMICSRSK